MLFDRESRGVVLGLALLGVIVEKSSARCFEAETTRILSCGLQ